MYARAQRAHCLFAQAPDGEHTAAQRDLARHGDIAVYRLPRQRGEHRCRDGDTGAGSVLGDGPLREVDMDVLRLVEVRRDAELLRPLAQARECRAAARGAPRKSLMFFSVTVTRFTSLVASCIAALRQILPS